MEEKKATLLLQDGTIYEGTSLGAQGSAIGEIVFTTGVVGFQETITSPSFCGQIVVQTFPITGNYGVNSEANEASKASAAGYVVRECCAEPSNFRNEGTLHSLLKEQGVVGIANIDTRALTIHLRENGTMNAIITTENIIDKAGLIAKLAEHCPQNLIEQVSCREIYYAPQSSEKYNVVVYDFGCDISTIKALENAGCSVTRVPYNTKLAIAMQTKPQGIVLAGGPGNPNDYLELANELKPLLTGETPTLGLGLGHQLLAIATGARVTHLQQAHRGANQAVHDTELNNTFATTQNHAYAVEEESLPANVAEVFCRNSNDKTCEGIIYKNAPVFSLQFCPEAFTGTKNTHYYIDKFVKMMIGVAK